MKHRVRLTGLGLLLAAACSAWAASKEGFAIAPYLQNTTTNAVSVFWETPRPVHGEVQYGKWMEPPAYPLAVAETRLVKLHRVRLEGLVPDTRYCYRVESEGSVHTGEFRTAPVANRPIRFAIIGDSRFWKEYFEQSRLPEHLAAQKPEFLLHMGDLVNKGHDHSLWPAHFARFGSLMAAVPMFVARGNHEGSNRDSDTDWFAKYDELPGGEPYSAFDWGNSHFALASYFALAGAAKGRTVRFLDQDLAASAKPWKFVAFHIPVYSTGYQSPADNRRASGDPAYEAVFDKHHLDMFFCGHTHIYERSFPYRGGQRDDAEGTVYLVQGGNVGGHYPAPWSAVVFTEMDMPHYTFVEVDNDHLELRSYGLAKGAKEKGRAAPIIEIDRYIRWRDEALPILALTRLESARGTNLVEAIASLGAMMYAPAAGRLAAYLNSPEPAVRRAAALALERIANPAVAETLRPALRHQDLAVRRSVARALEAAMPGALASRLEPDISDERQDSAVRVALLGAVLHHAPEQACALGLRALASPDNAVRDRAADLVKRTATKEEAPQLIELFQAEPRAYVAGCLAWGLNRLTGQKVDVTKAAASKTDEREQFIRKWAPPKPAPERPGRGSGARKRWLPQPHGGR